MTDSAQLDIVDLIEAATGVKHKASPLTVTTEPISLYECDCREALTTLADNSLDSCVTDPPYALVSVVKRFGKDGSAPCKTYDRPGATGAYARSSRGFMGQEWDNGEVSHDIAFWREVYRVLKPGAYVLSFGGTRTYHRLACAIEDAGFDVRDMVQWLYGSGFPKSHDLSKGIDKQAGAVREVTREGTVTRNGYGEDWDTGSSDTRPAYDNPVTDAAKKWAGYGSALKPACEPICMARKPLEHGLTIAANVLKWGTGAINIDGCRVGMSADDLKSTKRNGEYGETNPGVVGFTKTAMRTPIGSLGRFPANVITDGSDEVVAMFPNTKSGGAPTAGNRNGGVYGEFELRSLTNHGASSGSAARFFYQAKATKKDRAGSDHPTVKPVALLRYLTRLVTPPGGIVLDPFAGTGTTGEACHLEGFKVVMMEREPKYAADICARMKALLHSDNNGGSNAHNKD